MRSKKGRGTTVKVSLPLRSLPSTPTIKPHTNSLNPKFPRASVGFFGLGSIEAEPTVEPAKAKANRRLLGSMKKYCMQLGLLVYAADDNLNSNATVHIISESALRRLFQTNEQDLRRSLLSADSLQKPIIIICHTRDAALKLQAGLLGCSLPRRTQYLWLPIGPAKLAGALSACGTYHEDHTIETTSRPIEADLMIAGVLKESDYDSDVVAVGRATQGLPSDPEEEGSHAESPSFRDISLSLKHEDREKAIVSPVLPPEVPANSNTLQVPQSIRPQRSGSETSEKSIAASLRMREQINRAYTAPCVRTKTFSLLLVDDNVSTLTKLLSLGPIDKFNRLSICAFSKSLPRKADMPIVQHRTVRKPSTFTKMPQNKSAPTMSATIKPKEPSSQKSC